MMTQHEYWLLVQRYNVLDEKHDAGLLSRAEEAELADVDRRIMTAYQARDHIWDCVNPSYAPGPK